jgi:hypothetical protein
MGRVSEAWPESAEETRTLSGGAGRSAGGRDRGVPDLCFPVLIAMTSGIAGKKFFESMRYLVPVAPIVEREADKHGAKVGNTGIAAHNQQVRVSEKAADDEITGPNVLLAFPIQRLALPESHIRAKHFKPPLSEGDIFKEAGTARIAPEIRYRPGGCEAKRPQLVFICWLLKSAAKQEGARVASVCGSTRDRPLFPQFIQ